MITARGLIGVTALLAACGPSSDAPGPARGTPLPVTPPPAQPSFGWIELRDTADWDFGPIGGTRATLHVRGEVVDMVETTSVQPLPDGSVVYQQVQALDVNEESCNGPCYDLGPWMLYDGAHRALDQTLPLFSARMSSPGVVGSDIYYWGLDGIAGSDSVRITANRYATTDSSHTSLFLFNDVLATDNPDHLERPEFDGTAIVFRTFGRSFTADRMLSRVR